MDKHRPKIPPALVLFFLAPAIGELLSGSSPPLEFFKPFSLFLLSALYGGGALLARELALRWGKRWPTILALGLAYGIIEEGLMVKSFFDPAWMDLGLLGVYGRWAGVNWVWTVMLTLYHAVVSIAIPIMLVELIYPRERDTPWLGRGGMRVVTILLAVDVLFGFTLLTPYRPPLVPYLASGLAVFALYRLARMLPLTWSEQRSDPWGIFWLGLAGFLGTAALFFGGWALPALDFPAPLTIVFMLAAAFGFCRLIRWASGEGAWDDRGRWALVSGSLSVFILLALIAENDPGRVDDPSGMGMIGLIAALAVIYLGIRIRKRLRALSAFEQGTS
jgi:hypothetical protein